MSLAVESFFLDKQKLGKYNDRAFCTPRGFTYGNVLWDRHAFFFGKDCVANPWNIIIIIISAKESKEEFINTVEPLLWDTSIKGHFSWSRGYPLIKVSHDCSLSPNRVR